MFDIKTFIVAASFILGDCDMSSMKQQSYGITLSNHTSLYNGTFNVDLFGSIMSPNYDYGVYSNNIDMYWVLVSPTDFNQISLNFLHFLTELGHDYVYIYSGDQVDSGNHLFEYSGYKEPFQLIFNYSTITVRFTSDVGMTYNGFYATYCLPAHLQSKLTAKTETQYLTLPTYPSPYTPNSDLYWIIVSPEGSQVTLHWMELNTQRDQDFVNIYDKCSLLTPVFTRFSGNFTPPYGFTSISNCLTIQFTSDRTAEMFTGFKIAYTSTVVPCDDKPYYHFGNATNELIVSPNFPYNYCNHMTKFYYISVGYDYTIHLYFYNISLDINDYLLIYDSYGSYLAPNATLNYRSVAPYRFISTWRYLTLQFTTDYSGVSTGFRASFSSVFRRNSIHQDDGDDDDDKLDGGQIAGIVIGATILVVIVSLATVFVIKSKKKQNLISNRSISAQHLASQFPEIIVRNSVSKKLQEPVFTTDTIHNVRTVYST